MAARAKKVRETHPETGKPICGAPTKHMNKFGEFYCTNPPMRNDIGRCRKHGGKSKTGVNHPNYKTGRYIDPQKNLTALGEMVVKQLADKDAKSTRDELALLRARIAQIIDAVQDADKQITSVAHLKKAYATLLESLKEDDPILRRLGLEMLSQAIQGLEAEEQAWEEIRTTVLVVQKLVGTELQRDKIEQEYLHAAELTALMASLQDVILANVPEADRRVAIRAGFQNALLTRHLLQQG